MELVIAWGGIAFSLTLILLVVCIGGFLSRPKEERGPFLPLKDVVVVTGVIFLKIFGVIAIYGLFGFLATALLLTFYYWLITVTREPDGCFCRGLFYIIVLGVIIISLLYV